MNAELIRSLTIILLFAASACDKSQAPSESAPIAPTSSAAKVVKVSVGDHGFDPSSIRVAKGDQVALEFTRTSKTTCADKVVFPDVGISKDLPLDTPVAINVPTDEARKLTFQCGMGMYRSAVVVQ